VSRSQARIHPVDQDSVFLGVVGNLRLAQELVSLIIPSVHLVLDTCVIVAALRSKQGASNKILRCVALGTLSMSISVAALFEYEDVLLRKDKIPGYSVSELQRFLNDICALSRHQEIFFTWRPTLSDPDDEIFLELAVAASATHIVTYNTKDFSRAARFGIRVVTPSELLKEI
jgi:putative PIN family toxin of toxin-antitoxin system